MSAPSPNRLAARALVLCAVVARAYLEEGAGDAHTEQLRQQILGWLAQLELLDAPSAREKKLLERPVGRLGQREQVDASWLSEGLAVLAWALGRGDFPQLDDHVDPRRVADSLGFLHEAAGALLALPTVRPEQELAIAEARLTLVAERLHAFSQDRARLDLPAMAAGSALGPLVLEGLPLVEGDLRVDGRALSEAPEARWRELLDASVERARAIAWVRGNADLYGL